MNKYSFLRLGALGGILTNCQTVMAWDRPVRAWAHIEDETYLAIEFCSRVHTDHGKYGSYESGKTRNGIDLLVPRGEIQSEFWAEQQDRIVNTNPYRPAVGSTPSDDLPLKVKSDEELPAGSGRPSHSC